MHTKTSKAHKRRNFSKARSRNPTWSHKNILIHFSPRSAVEKISVHTHYARLTQKKELNLFVHKKKLGKNLSALKPVMRLRYSDVVIILTSMPSRSLVFVERSPQNCKRKAFSENQLRSCLAALDTNKQFLLIILNFVVAVLPSFLHEHSHSHNLLLNKLECWLWIGFFCLFLCKLILTRFA